MRNRSQFTVEEVVEGREGRRGFLSPVTGVFLVTLAVVVTAGVAVVVHFLLPRGDKPEAEQWENCKQLAPRLGQCK